MFSIHQKFRLIASHFPQKSFWILCLSLSLISTTSTTSLAEPVDSDILELNVPDIEFADILAQSRDKLLISQAEFVQLQKTMQARSGNRTGAPAVLLGRTDYNVKFAGTRLLAEVDLQLQASAPGLLELPFSGWKILKADWPSPSPSPSPNAAGPENVTRDLTGISESLPLISRSAESDSLLVFVPSAGERMLRLQLVLEPQSGGVTAGSVSREPTVYSLRLFGGTSGELSLTVPERDEISVDGVDLATLIDAQSVAKFAVGGRHELRLQVGSGDQTSTFAKYSEVSSQISARFLSEILQYESQSTVRLTGIARDRIQFRMPAALQVESIISPDLVGWDIEPETVLEPLASDTSSGSHPESSQLVTLRFHEAIKLREIKIKAAMKTELGREFSVPHLQWIDVDSQSGTIKVINTSELRLQIVNAAGVSAIQVDPTYSLFAGAYGRDFRFWGDPIDLTIVSVLKQAGLQAAVRNVLTIHESKMNLDSALIVEAIRAPIFELRIRFPTSFSILEVKSSQPLSNWSLSQAEAGVTELLIELVEPLNPGVSTRINLQAETHPEGWPIWDEPKSISIPNFELMECELAEIDFGIISNQEFELAPLESEEIEPVSRVVESAETANLTRKYRLDFQAQSFKYSGRFQIARVPGIITVDSNLLLKIETDFAVTRLVSRVKVWGGGVKSLQIDTPVLSEQAVRFTISQIGGDALPVTIIEQVAASPVNQRRLWDLNFDQALIGEYRLECQVVQPRLNQQVVSPVDFRFPQAISQSGLIAITVPEKQWLQVTTQSSDGFPLTTTDLADVPEEFLNTGSDYLAAFRFTQTGWTVAARLEPLTSTPLANAIANTLQLTSYVDSTSEQHQADFRFLVAQTQSLIVDLPAGSRVLSAKMNGQNVVLGQTAEGIQISTIGLGAEHQHLLSLIYERSSTEQNQSEDHSGKRRSLVLNPPTFWSTTSENLVSSIPVMSQKWSVGIPKSDLVMSSAGRFIAESETLPARLRHFQQLFQHPSKSIVQILIPFGVIFVFLLLYFRISRCVDGWQKRRVFRFLILLGLFIGATLVLFAESAIHLIPRETRNVSRIQDLQLVETNLNPNPVPLLVNQPESLSQESIMPISEMSAANWTHYHYAGMHVSDESHALILNVLPVHTVHSLSAILISLMILLAWCIRDYSLRFRLLWLWFTTAVPLACLAIVNGLWSFVLLAVLIGSLAGLLSWVIAGVLRLLVRQRERFWKSSALIGSTSAILMMLLLSSSTAQAQVGFAPDSKNAQHVYRTYQSLDRLGQSGNVWIDRALYEAMKKSGITASSDFINSGTHVLEASFTGQLTETESGLVQLQVSARWVISHSGQQTVAVTLPMPEGVLSDLTRNGQPFVSTKSESGENVVQIPSSPIAQILTAEIFCKTDGTFRKGSLKLPANDTAIGRLDIAFPAQGEHWEVALDNQDLSLISDAATGLVSVEIPVQSEAQRTLSWSSMTTAEIENVATQIHQRTSVTAQDDGLQNQTEWTIQVQRGGLKRLTLQMPAELRLQELTGSQSFSSKIVPTEANLASDSPPEAASETKLIEIEFDRLITEKVVVRVRSLQPVSIGQTPVEVTLKPVIIVHQAIQQLQLGLFSHPGLTVSKISEKELSPQALTVNAQPELVPQLPRLHLRQYRAASEAFELKFEIQRPADSLKAAVFQAVQVQTREVLVATKFELSSPTSNRRQVEFLLPESYQLIDVTGPQLQDWSTMILDSQKKLIVELHDTDNSAIEINLEGKIPRLNGQASISLVLPTVEATTQSTTLAVWGVAGEQLKIAETPGWQSLPSDKLDERYRPLNESSPQFLFKAETDAEPFTLQLQKIMPAVEAVSVTTIAVGNSTIDYGLFLRWKVTQSATDTFAFTVPEWMGELEFDRSALRQVRSEKTEGNQRRWILTTRFPVEDQFLASAVATVALPVDQIIQTPQLFFQYQHGPNPHADLTSQQHFVTWVNLSRSQIDVVDASKMEVVQPTEIPLLIPPQLVRQAVSICRIRSNKIPLWRMTRMQDSATSKAVVLQATLNTVIEPDGSWRTQAVYTVRNRGQQYLAIRIPPKSTILSSMVRGQPSRILNSTLNGEEIVLIGLPPTSAADLSFDAVITIQGALPKALPKRWSVRARDYLLPTPKLITPEESAELGVVSAQCLWNVSLPENLIVKPDDRRSRTNVQWHTTNLQAQENSFRKQRIESEVSELLSIYQNSSNSFSQRSRAMNNLRAFNRQVDLAKEAPSGGFGLDLWSEVPGQSLADGVVIEDESRATKEEFSTRLSGEQKDGATPAPEQELGNPGFRMRDNAVRDNAVIGNQGYIISNNAVIGNLNGISIQQLDLNEATRGGFRFSTKSSEAAQSNSGTAISEIFSARDLPMEMNSQTKLNFDSQTSALTPQGLGGLGEGGSGMMGDAIGGGMGGLPGAGPTSNLYGTRQNAGDNLTRGGAMEQSGNLANVKQRSQLRMQLENLSEQQAAPGMDSMGQPSKSSQPHWPVHPTPDNSSSINAPQSWIQNADPAVNNPFSSLVITNSAISRSDPQRQNFGNEADFVEARIPVPPSGQISLLHDLPVSGQTLTFSCIGGNPELTLIIRGRGIVQNRFAIVWGVAILLISAIFICKFSARFRSLAIAMMLIGLCVALIPQAASFALGYILFLFGGIALVVIEYFFRPKRLTAQ